MEKIKYAVLIDDYEPVNKFHDIIIRTANLFEEYKIFNSGIDALEHFQEENKIPDLILLDINMPKMNGWEFLEEYEKLDERFHQTVIVMLTTSISTYDLNRSNEHPLVEDFIKKPLTIVRLKEVVNMMKEVNAAKASSRKNKTQV